MKIYLIPIDKKYYIPPKINPWCEHSVGFNIETNFFHFLKISDLLTSDPSEADWHYLPLYWTFWQLSHGYGLIGRNEMQDYLDKVILDHAKTFTVSEADNEPNFEIGQTRVFTGNGKPGWTPVPLITKPHEIPDDTQKVYLSNFVGKIRPWTTRIKMAEAFENRDDVKIINSSKGEKLFVKTILESYSTLCPRGSALGSYRFYESMQLGVVPIMISDIDFRPFPDQIDWESCSYYTDSAEGALEILDSTSTDILLNKGKKAADVWYNQLYSNGWCRMVLDQL